MADRTSTITLAVKDAYSVNVQAFAKALQQADDQTTKLSASMKAWKSANAGAKDMLMGMGVALPINPMMAFGQALSFTIDRALEAEKVTFATNAVIKSTGGAAGYSAGEISKMADKFSMLTGVDDEVIQSAENVMLTFTSIGKDKFPEAMTAAQNLSAALGQDLQSSVIQVGKALQDPILGMTALRRVGVNFNESAKETVKHLMDIGDQAGAQKFILAELNKEFGGMAAAMGDTAQGKMNKFKIAIENVGEAIGNKLIPVLGKAADAALLLLNGSQQLTDLFVAHSKEVFNTSKTYKDYNAEIIRSARLTGDLGQEVKGAELNLYNNRKAAGLTTDGYTELDGIVYKATENFKLYTAAQYEAMRGEYGVGGAADETTRAMQRAKPAIDSTTEATDGLTGALQGTDKASRELNATQDLLKAGTQELTKEFIYQEAAQGLDAKAALELGLQMGVLNSDTVNAALAVQALKEKYDTNKNGAIEATEATAGYSAEVRNLANSINNLHDKEVNITVRYTEEGRLSGQEGGLLGGKQDNPEPTPQPKSSTPKNKVKPRTNPGDARAAGGPVYPGHSYTVGESGMEHLSIGANGVGYVTPLNDNRNQSKVTINVYTSQPVTPQALALMRAQAGAY